MPQISIFSTKRFLLVLVSATLLVNLFLPLIANTQESPTKCKMREEVKLGDTTCSKDEEILMDSDKAACCFISTLHSVRDWLFYILLIVASIFIIVAAYYFVTAAGKPEQITQARNFVIYALIGVVVAFMARGMVELAGVIARGF